MIFVFLARVAGVSTAPQQDRVKRVDAFEYGFVLLLARIQTGDRVADNATRTPIGRGQTVVVAGGRAGAEEPERSALMREASAVE